MTLVSARKAMERRMTQQCTIRRPASGVRELDPVTLLPVTAPAVVWSGPCMQGHRLAGRAQDSGHGDFRAETEMLRISVTVEEEIRVDDQVTVDTGEGAGAVWMIVAAPVKTVQVTRRFRLERLVQEVQHS